MKLLELTVKNFGKISAQSWKLKEGINLVYGENESGKSTLYTFIKSMLFGMERGRGRAARNDEFSQYEPWENPNYYAGKLRFECGGRTFCLERSFDRYSKSASLVCEDDGEELSLEHGDLEMLLDGMTADSYENTVAVGQLKAEIDQTLASKLLDYAANYYVSGNNEIHLEKALEYLKNKKKEIEKQFREDLMRADRKQEKITQECSYIRRDMHRIEQKIEKLDEELETKTVHEQRVQEKPRWRVNPLELLTVSAAVVVVFMFVPEPWNIMLVTVGALAELIYIWNRTKDGKRRNQEVGEIGKDLDKLRWEKAHLQEELREKQIQNSNLEEALEELQEVSGEYKIWQTKQQALDLACGRLSELSGQMQKTLGQELNEKTSEILNDITGGKYRRIIADDAFHISLLTEEKKIPLERLSRGTIEQVYFALRMAAAGVLYDEEFPVILDDTFVFYDEKRLSHTLRWLADNKKQVILFTCQKREREIMDKMGIAFHSLD